MARNSHPGKHRRSLWQVRRSTFRRVGITAAGAAGLLVPVFMLAGSPTTSGQGTRAATEGGIRTAGPLMIPSSPSGQGEALPTTDEVRPNPVRTAEPPTTPTDLTTGAVASTAGGSSDEHDPCTAPAASPSATQTDGAPPVAQGDPTPPPTAAVAPPTVDAAAPSGCSTTTTTGATTSPMPVPTSSEHGTPSSGPG